ncbi:MAG: sigma-54-dependent Fis family transcriptional regulator [Treponema sp.]|nr:sigma-54-dependent Fis family transcriptional regulator [Treponema sp.]
MGEVTSIGIERLKALVEITTSVNSNYTDSNALLVSILESVMCLVQCESSSVLLVNNQDDSLKFMVALGPKGAEAKNITVSKNSIAGWVVSHNQAVIVNDVRHDRRFNSLVQERTNYITRNMIAFPMHVGNECVGVIEVLNKTDFRDFDEEDLAILELFGNQAGVAYQNAHLYSKTKDSIVVLQDAVSQGKDYHTFVGKSPIILDILKVVEEVAKTSSSVLIIGESGVGKELFAEQLHLKSDRRNQPFVRVSCAALSPTLLESELFGHVKGAYTNANSSRVGRFEMADGGTLFLDEIGEMPLDLQAKLLRVIQEKKFERVGSSETISVDVRIIAATNRNLEEMVKNKTFRDDLYYRLNVLPLNIPPLRRRKDDIEPLANFFLQKYSNEMKKNFQGFSSAASKALYTYSWPGNVRELENSIERACILGQGPLIQMMDLRLPLPDSDDRDSYGDMVHSSVEDLINTEDRTLKTALSVFKKQYLTRILEQTGWNQTKTAQILDVQRTYVSRLMGELDIKKPK